MRTESGKPGNIINEESLLSFFMSRLSLYGVYKERDYQSDLSVFFIREMMLETMSLVESST